jgi:hypothetical protein
MLTFPLSTTQFFNKLPIMTPAFSLGEAMQISVTGGGEVLPAARGTRLWRGQISFGPMKYVEMAEVEGLVEALRQPGRSFMAYDSRYPWPASDPRGTIVAARSVVIASLPAGARTITLSGLTSAYAIPPGTYLAFAYGSDPVRQALHRVIVGGVANGAGVTPALEVVPAIRPGAATGAAVTLIRAACKARILPGTTEPGESRRGIVEGFTFGFIQTLR